MALFLDSTVSEDVLAFILLQPFNVYENSQKSIIVRL